MSDAYLSKVSFPHNMKVEKGTMVVSTRSKTSPSPTKRAVSKTIKVKRKATATRKDKKNTNKTTITSCNPAKFIAAVEPENKRKDATDLLSFFNKVTGLKPKLWGPTIVGYGKYHYKYDSGREGDHMMTGFSPRKQNMTVYIMPGYQFESMKEKLSRLGKHKLGKSCLYINKLSDIDMEVLKEIVLEGLAYMRDKYETCDE